MRAIEIAFAKYWLNLWLETYSSLVVHAFQSSNLIPCQVTSRWNNVMILHRNMDYIVTHIYRKGNHVADCLTNYGITLNSYVYWYDIPLFAKKSYVKKKIGLPSFGFSSF